MCSGWDFCPSVPLPNRDASVTKDLWTMKPERGLSALHIAASPGLVECLANGSCPITIFGINTNELVKAGVAVGDRRDWMWGQEL